MSTCFPDNENSVFIGRIDHFMSAFPIVVKRTIHNIRIAPHPNSPHAFEGK